MGIKSMKKALLLGLLAISFVSQSQTLNDSFNKLKDDSESFKVYKVIKQTELNQFWDVVSDSVSQLKSTIVKAQNEKQMLDTELAQQKSVIEGKDAEIASLIHDTNHITVLGIDFFKEAYIGISFSVVIALIVAMSFFLTKWRNSQTTTKQKVADWKKIHEELEALKKDSLEKQMKLRRELQTQLNKLNEIRST